MTIKDILDTPIHELWESISPFAIGYLIFGAVMFVLVLSFIFYVSVKVIKDTRRFDKQRSEIEERLKSRKIRR